MNIQPIFVLFVYFVVKDLYKINRPSRLRRAIGFDLSDLSTSKASPNDTGIVIIVIIIAIGKLDAVVHRGADYSTELFDLVCVENFDCNALRLVEYPI
ncbi:MAG: hypothetical protein IPN58_09875 [Anaerolineales bacterium]|nr:hypothetical protein [Anaerolineales bacterium]